MHHDTLSSFRHRIYGYLGKAQDTTFELIDAVLTTRHVYSFAELDLFRNNKEVENGVVGNCFHCDEPELLQPANSLDARASTGG
jgi:hypothetical protein